MIKHRTNRNMRLAGRAPLSNISINKCYDFRFFLPADDNRGHEGSEEHENDSISEVIDAVVLRVKENQYIFTLNIENKPLIKVSSTYIKHQYTITFALANGNFKSKLKSCVRKMESVLSNMLESPTRIRVV